MKKATVIRLAAMLLATTLAIAAPLTALAAPDTEPLFVIRENGLYGYMNSRGETVIEPQWSYAGDFRGNYAAVSIDDESDGVIDRSGNYVLEPKYTTDEGYDGGYYGGKDTGVIWASDYEGTGFFDIPSGFFSGTIYDQLTTPWAIGDGLIGVCDDEGNYSYVDRTTGETVIPGRLLYHITGFSEGFACVYTDEDYSTYEIIDKTGKALEFPEGFIADSIAFSEGRIMVRDTRTNLLGFADTTGAVVIPAAYEEAFDFSEGYASVCVGGLWGHIDAQGNMICAPKYGVGYSFVNGFASIGDNYTSTVINTAGEELFTMDGMNIGIFNENGVAAYDTPEDVEAFGIIDLNGNVKLPAEKGYRFEYTYAFGYEDLFAEGLQVLTKDGLFGFVNELGEVVVDFKYSYARNFVDGLALVRTADNKTAYINHDGETVWAEK